MYRPLFLKKKYVQRLELDSELSWIPRNKQDRKERKEELRKQQQAPHIN